ncbi:MAG: TetR/AcrR family transcriptional regulator [Bacillota bacterium]|nr:TetR/AcrR family transcriptional regulator [Bacillota bacterium]
MRRTDPRSERSQLAYREALTRLLQRKPLDQISVSELSVEAGLNRSTFYLHYSNVRELLDDIENDMLAEFQAMLDRFTERTGGEVVPLFDPFDRTSIATLAELFTIIRNNAGYAATMLANPTESRLLRRVLEEGRETTMRLWRPLLEKESQTFLDYYYNFIAGGFIGTTLNWIEEGMRMQPLELAQLCLRFIYQGMLPSRGCR